MANRPSCQVRLFWFPVTLESCFSAFLFCFSNLSRWRHLVHPGFFLEKGTTPCKKRTQEEVRPWEELSWSSTTFLLFHSGRFGSGCIFCAVTGQDLEQNAWHVSGSLPLPSFPFLPFPGLRTGDTFSSALPWNCSSHLKPHLGLLLTSSGLSSPSLCLPSWALGWAPSELGGEEQLALKKEFRTSFPSPRHSGHFHWQICQKGL